jgi:NTP pyrophosphatase (non-canonical NTP hydrolase)
MTKEIDPILETVRPRLDRITAIRAIDLLCENIHAAQRLVGWWDQADNPLVVPTKIALIVSECAEALEGHRKGSKDDKLPQYDMIAAELADVLIRVFDLAGFLKIPLGTIIAEKEAFNASRADHKPENRAAKGGKKY